MRYSTLLTKTLREEPKDAEFMSHKLLVKAGYISQVASGVYNYLPLGLRTLNKISNVVRKHMEKIECHELLMPALTPRALWQESGRWDTVDVLLKCEDKHGGHFALNPTHEEVITDIARHAITSYKHLPASVFQIQNKFRDETRFKGGLARGKEFIMKDAYSFHASENSLNEAFNSFKDAYHAIFKELQLPVVDVQADAGSIGGSGSREFMAPIATGEDTLLVCDKCDFKSNVEAADCIIPKSEAQTNEEEKQEVHTPGKASIEEVCGLLQVQAVQTIKSVVYEINKENSFVLALIRGDLDINETKLTNHVGAHELDLASDRQIEELGLIKGFISPDHKATEKMTVVADKSLEGTSGMVTGADKADYHLTGVTLGRDWSAPFTDIANAKEGFACPHCKEGTLSEEKGLEMGHIFKLGTKYSNLMKARFIEANNKQEDIVMGCYGIGISRTMAALAEKYHDEKGLMLPENVAPFKVHLISIGKSEELKAKAEEIYAALKEKDIEVLFDDRKENPGVKLNDADLIGAPHRIVVSEKLLDGDQLEYKARSSDQAVVESTQQVIDKVL